MTPAAAFEIRLGQAGSWLLRKRCSIYLSSWGWKRPLETVKSNFSAQAGSATAGYPGSCPFGFWVFPSMESQLFWAICASIQLLS